MLTCYSPVRHSVAEATPCDLHVLSTPPAFVLSQNQTLHNNYLRNCWTIRMLLLTVPCTPLRKPFSFGAGLLAYACLSAFGFSSRRESRHASRPFPSLSLSSPSAPHGRFESHRACLAAAPAPRKVLAEKIVCPADPASIALGNHIGHLQRPSPCPFEPPRSGVPLTIHLRRPNVKHLFEFFSLLWRKQIRPKLLKRLK